MIKKTLRYLGDEHNLNPDPFIWKLIHWLTMHLLGHRITRGYNAETKQLVTIYWDKASNWTDDGEDWARKDVPYPKPIWKRHV